MGVYLRPRRLEEALSALARPSARPHTVLAGGTDFYPARVGRAIDEDVLDIGGIDVLRGITAGPTGWRLGATTTNGDGFGLGWYSRLANGHPTDGRLTNGRPTDGRPADVHIVYVGFVDATLPAAGLADVGFASRAEPRPRHPGAAQGTLTPHPRQQPPPHGP